MTAVDVTIQELLAFDLIPKLELNVARKFSIVSDTLKCDVREDFGLFGVRNFVRGEV